MINEVRDTAIEWAFTTGWRVTKRVPESAGRKVFQMAADTMWRRHGDSVQQLERNLARVNPSWTSDELRELSRAGMRSYLRYWYEAFRLPSWSHERISGTFDLAGQELMDEAVRSGTGAVMVPCHMANWDHAGAWGCLRFGGVTTVAERLRPEGLFNQFLAYRQTL
ncbi:MAG: phosphatidylinositol mannoside acyltransferase, partial [Actinomycetota bacterium]|nr:phosphatidylinositol mannoside acyltransferase [Actinomycetota bacterium]